MYKKIIILMMVVCSGYVHGIDFKQKAAEKAVAASAKMGEELHKTLALAQRMGFLVDEIRFEASITPKVEVYFRDTGDKGNASQIISSAKKSQKVILRLLQATRKFEMAHYSPTGVKLVTGVAKPSVEILTTYIN